MLIYIYIQDDQRCLKMKCFKKFLSLAILLVKPVDSYWGIAPEPHYKICNDPDF